MKHSGFFLLLSAGTLIAASLSPVANAGELKILVKGITKAEGKLWIGVFDNKKDFKKKAIPESTKDDITETGEMLVTIKDLEPGTYAFIAFQDLNGNGECDLGKWGIPTEPVAFSNMPRMRLGPPNFKECVINVNDAKPTEVEVTLQTRE